MIYKTITSDCSENTTAFEAAVNQALKDGWEFLPGSSLVITTNADHRYRSGQRSYTRELICMRDPEPVKRGPGRPPKDSSG